MSDAEKCDRCEGCGKIANSESGEPWIHWMDLPLKSSAAVVMGIVKPIACPECKGSGIKGVHQIEVPNPPHRFVYPIGVHLELPTEP